MYGVLLILSALLIIAGFCILFLGFVDKKSFKLKLIGALIFSVGIGLFILLNYPTDKYTEWKETTEKTVLAEIEDGQYLIEMQNEYLYKAVTYSYSGENTLQYLKIQKGKNISVETTENKWSDEAYMVFFTRYPKNVFGHTLNTLQTKYIFYTP